MSSDPLTITELLLQILGRLGRIEDRLTTLENNLRAGISSSSPTASDPRGIVHTIPDRPPSPDTGTPTGHRVIHPPKDRAPGGGSSPPVEPSSDH
jgi:hypothetical protein